MQLVLLAYLEFPICSTSAGVMCRARVLAARKTRNKTPPRRRNGLTRDLVTKATSGEKEHAEVALENENKVRRAENGSGEASTEGSLGDKRLEGVVGAPFDSGRGIVRPPKLSRDRKIR